MKINLAKSAGFCFGVKRALKIALETASTKAGICMLGDVVHNEEVVNKIKKSGIEKISHLTPQKDKILLIPAHGIPIATVKKAIQLGYKIADATCPMVKQIHKTVQKMEKEGYRIIVAGDKKHDEVLGIVGQLKHGAVVIDDPDTLPIKTIKKINKACVVAQSTQNLENVLRLVESLKPHIKKLKFCNTICMPTRIKQEEIKKLPLENDAIIVIGSKGSANTKRLYEISKSLNERTYWVTSKNELKKTWFKDTQSVGITAGASTPEETTQEILEYIRRNF